MLTERTIREIRMAAIVLLLCLASSLADAQPRNPADDIAAAEQLNAAAMELVKENTVESLIAAVEKFDAAAELYGRAEAGAKRSETLVAAGLVLRSLGTYYSDKDVPEAARKFEAAVERFVQAGRKQEEAYVLHDLGYLMDSANRVVDSIKYYERAVLAYRAAMDRPGESAVLRNLGLIHHNSEHYGEAAAYLEAALKISGELNDNVNVSLTLINLGDAYYYAYELAKAQDRYEKAVAIRRILKDTAGEIEALIRRADALLAAYKADEALSTVETIFAFGAELTVSDRALAKQRQARAYRILTRLDDAERSLNEAAIDLLAVNNMVSYGWTLLELGSVYFAKSEMGRVDEAAEKALKTFADANNESGRGYTMILIADAANYRNEFDTAISRAEQAKKIFEGLKDNSGIVASYKMFASIYQSTSRFDDAIRAGQTAARLAEKIPDPNQRADVLITLGTSFSDLAQYETSLKLYNEALAVARRTGNYYSESILLCNIGYDYLKIKDLTKAKKYFEEALVLMRAKKMRREEGYTVHNLGLVYFNEKNYEKALELYSLALPIYLDVKDRRPEAFLYDSLGETYRELGQFERAARELQKALILAREIRFNQVEANALGNLMHLYATTAQPNLAILYGKQAINSFQAVRSTNRGLEKDALKSFVKSHEKMYRQLADLMAEQGRLPEAQQVLDLLKEEEFFEFVRRDAAEAADQAKLSLNETEKKALEEYTRLSGQLTALGARFQSLQEKRVKAGGKLEPAEEAEFDGLKKQIEDAGEGMRTFLAKLASEFSKSVEDGATVTPASIETLRADLRRAGNDVVLVSTYLLPERYRAIVTTGRTMVDRKVEYKDIKLSAAEINKKIAAFKNVLQDPRIDPRPMGKELYDIFIKPLESDLRGAGAKTILWSLDGSLRYIPMAALSPDGKTYLAEHYQNVVITLARQTNLFSKPSGEEWRAIGAGVSKQHAGFSALPSVPREINSIVRGADETGVLAGRKLIDEEFNLESFRNAVPQQTEDGTPFNVVHLATHFSLGVNNQDSALLLGDGTRLSLYDIARDEELDFKDIELLTLSACETGVSTGDGSGREVESLGMIAQQKGAKAVMATLWKVADESTSLYMSEFYRLKKVNPKMTKAEAVRQAQLAMIHGKIKSSGTGGGCRSEFFKIGKPQPADFKCDADAPFSHPYFWSPFVLIGNWR